MDIFNYGRIEFMEIISLIAIILLVALVLWQNSKIQKIANSRDQEIATNLIKTDLVELNKSLNELRENFGQNLISFNEKVSEKLERNNFQLQNSMTKQLGESSKIVEEVSKRLTKLDETNNRVITVADELKTLQNVLQNPKQRGVFGEFYLGQVLENILPPNTFQLQYKFENGEAVDAAIFLEKGNILPVDSKFSLENYNRMIESQGEERKQLAKKVQQDLKGRIDETANIFALLRILWISPLCLFQVKVFTMICWLEELVLAVLSAI